MKVLKNKSYIISKVSKIIKFPLQKSKIVFLKEALEIYAQEMDRKFGRRVAIYPDRDYRNYHEHTIKYLIDNHGDVRIRFIDKKFIIDNIIIPQRRAGLADKTIRNRVCTLKSCLRYLNDMCMINNKKLPDITEITRMLDGETPRTVYLKPKDLERLVYHAKKIDDILPRMIIFFVETGLRKNELLSLKWCDVDFTSNTIHIRNAKNSARDGNSGKDRIVSLSTRAKNQIQHMRKKSNPNSYVFSTPKGKRYVLYKNFILARKGASLEHIKIHDLRKTFATWRIQGIEGKQLGIHQISKILGHSDIRTTERSYAHLESGMIKL